MIKKLILMLILLLVAATVHTVQAGVIVDEDFSSYADTSFIGADFGTPGPTGWFYAGQSEGPVSLVDLSASPVGAAPGATTSGLLITFGATSGEKDTNLGYFSPSFTYDAMTIYTLEFDLAVGQGATDDIGYFFRINSGGFVSDKIIGVTPNDGWVHLTLVGDTSLFPGAVGAPVQLQFNMDGGQTGTAGGDTFYFTNVKVTSQLIPEPATFLLLGFGALLLRRKR